MIIVLFHAFYLFGKYVYENFYTRKEKTEDTNISIVPNMQLVNVSEADYQDSKNNDELLTHNIKVKFFPPVYVQRYNAVQSVLASGEYHGKIHKVIDFGCAELSFAIHLKNTDGVQEIYCIDVDRSLLEHSQTKVAPLHCDYLSLRTEPLTIHVCEGSIAYNDNKLANTDAVICIELIEHLYPDDLDAFPYNVFGFIKPQVAIVTTPNADFNVLFRLVGFRHADHKFEWTRAQFQDWANNIILRYPDYEVSFHGIGSGPDGTEHLGSCSQMAVFHRHTSLYSERAEGVDDLLKTVVSHKYPYRVDNRCDEEKMLTEAEYYIRLYSTRDEEFIEEIPLKKLMFSVEKFHISIDILRSILEEANWAIEDRENGPVVLIPPQSMFSSNYEQDFDDDFLENDYRLHDHEDDWNDLELGAPSGYFFDTDMERDEQNNEEEENWDDETHDARHSSNSNRTSENLLNSELHISGDSNHISDNQWTMEDLNNEIPLLDPLPQQPGVTINSVATETELPSNSFLIGLDPTDINYLNISNDILNSSEHNLSSSYLPLPNSTETSDSLGTDSSHTLSMNRNPALPGNNAESSPQSRESIKNSELDWLSNPESSLRSRDCKNQIENDDNHLASDNERPSTEFQGFYNFSEPKNDPTKLPCHNSSSLCSEPTGISNVGCNSAQNETSSVSTVEAALLLSREQSSVMENKDSLFKDQELMRNTKFLNDKKKCLDSSNHSAAQGSNASLLGTEQSTSENDNCYDLDSIHLQPAQDSNNSLCEKDEIFHLSIKDFSSGTNESCRNLDFSCDSINSSYQKCETDLIDAKKIEYHIIKNEDSMSFKSISNSSLDLKPKFTSSPQILSDIHKNQTQSVIKAQELVDKQSLDDYKSTSVLQTLQNPHMKENISPSTSQLSLQSNSNVSLSTATSTGSSNVEKWYTAETNPMYQRDLVVLKGGNDSVDNPSEETTSDSDATLSGSERGRDRETNEKFAEILTLDAGETDKNIKTMGDTSRNIDDDINTQEIFPQQIPDSNRLASFLLSARKTNHDDAQRFSSDRSKFSTDSVPLAFTKQIANEDIPSLDILRSCSSEKSQFESVMSICKSIPSNEVPTSYNASKICKERGQLKYEFDIARGSESVESKPFSPESLDTPPNSWSPEIMDSGYPNSASVHDITPEYELSSIANDRTSDSDSASIAEIPVQGFYEFIEVENGDLANNNRDDEGNNVIAFQADDLDDLQPLIDVLENDMENENDIYAVQNGFPLWLLRILEMANPIDLDGIGGLQVHQHHPAPVEQAGGDAPNVNAENDEGFDSSSSDDDTDIEDDEVDDATTGSSDETEDHSGENLARDWRAGGDP